MGKILSLLIGAIVAILGLILFVAWFYEFLFIVKGVLPVMLILGGVIAVIAGLGELKDVVAKKNG